MTKKKFQLYTVTIIIVVTLALVFFIFSANGKYNPKKNLTIVFYNVENLFDTINVEGKRDGEFTPENEKNWNSERYYKKLNDISRVLSSINKEELPELIGLCEIENHKVLEDLIKTDGLNKTQYQIAQFESPDLRGIDVALLYRPDEFYVINQKPIPIVMEGDSVSTTRDILYVKGKTKNREIFHIFVNHWPSRIGGTEKTEPKRIHVASILRHNIDSILEINHKANIIVMGDMNDEPVNNSLANILKASYSLSSKDNGLVNLMYKLDKEGKGTYKFQGKWNMLDNLIVSSSLFDKKGFECTGYGMIFHEEWMEFRNRNGDISPNRTYGGSKYYGGISDHFPVYFKMTR